MCNNYKQQDKQADRDTSNNVNSKDDYEALN
jgi:hypothetical protein